MGPHRSLVLRAPTNDEFDVIPLPTGQVPRHLGDRLGSLLHDTQRTRPELRIQAPPRDSCHDPTSLGSVSTLWGGSAPANSLDVACRVAPAPCATIGIDVGAMAELGPPDGAEEHRVLDTPGLGPCLRQDRPADHGLVLHGHLVLVVEQVTQCHALSVGADLNITEPPIPIGPRACGRLHRRRHLALPSPTVTSCAFLRARSPRCHRK